MLSTLRTHTSTWLVLLLYQRRKLKPKEIKQLALSFHSWSTLGKAWTLGGDSSFLIVTLYATVDIPCSDVQSRVSEQLS